jgi:hypothetical protein
MSDPTIFDESNPTRSPTLSRHRITVTRSASVSSIFDEAVWVIDLYRNDESDAAKNARLWARNPDDCQGS